MFIFHFSVTSTLIDFSVNGSSQCTSTSFVRPSSNIYICRHHLSARFLTFTLLVIFFLLLVTATVNLHSIVNGTVFTTFEHINLGADLSNFRLVFVDGSDSEYFGCYFRHFCQYPKEVTDIWKQVHYLLLTPSLKFTSFNGISLLVYF